MKYCANTPPQTLSLPKSAFETTQHLAISNWQLAGKTKKNPLFAFGFWLLVFG